MTQDEWCAYVETLTFDEARALIRESIRKHESREHVLSDEMYAEALEAYWRPGEPRA